MVEILPPNYIPCPTTEMNHEVVARTSGPLARTFWWKRMTSTSGALRPRMLTTRFIELFPMKMIISRCAIAYLFDPCNWPRLSHRILFHWPRWWPCVILEFALLGCDSRAWRTCCIQCNLAVNSHSIVIDDLEVFCSMNTHYYSHIPEYTKFSSRMREKQVQVLQNLANPDVSSAPPSSTYP